MKRVGQYFFDKGVSFINRDIEEQAFREQVVIRENHFIEDAYFQMAVFP